MKVLLLALAQLMLALHSPTACAQQLSLLAAPLLLFGVAGFVLYMNRFQIGPEERALASLFGDDYAAYCQQVRRWL